MEPGFWQQRWKEGRIGFHQERETPLMLKHWPSLQVPTGSQVFVPLAGKSQDMLWFVSQGYRVFGVELALPAIEQFLGEHALHAETRDSAAGRHYRAGDLELVHGDVFAQDPAELAGCDAVYDRAALIALPPALRQRYASEVYARLPIGCRGLLITLEYPQAEKAGPPFSVEENEVRGLFSPQWEVGVLERREILAQQRNFSAEGVTALETVVYDLRRK